MTDLTADLHAAYWQLSPRSARDIAATLRRAAALAPIGCEVASEFTRDAGPAPPAERAGKFADLSDADLAPQCAWPERV